MPAARSKSSSKMQSGVRESHAGHEFHWLFAARRLLDLLDSKSGLTAVKIEGLAISDTEVSWDAELISDLTLYFGGEDAASCTSFRIEQFKYSVASDPSGWTFGKLSKTKGKSGVLPRLAKAWGDFSKRKWAGKLTVSLVSNAPLSPEVTAALNFVSNGSYTDKAVIKLIAATGLTAQDAEEFLNSLDLQCGQSGRLVQEVAMQQRLLEHFRSDGYSVSAKLMDFIRRMAGSEGERVGIINRAMLLAALQVSEEDLFPCPPKFKPPVEVIPTEYPASLAKTLQVTDFATAHAGAGMGKSTTLQKLHEALPKGSVVILYDCYGGGASMAERRLRSRTDCFVTQITNELAKVNLARLMIGGWRDKDVSLVNFQATLARAASEVEAAGGMLVIAADAVDDAFDASKGEWFLPAMEDIHWPAGAKFVVSSRTHRLEDLPERFRRDLFQIGGFNLRQSSAHLRQFWPNATDAECLDFHLRTGGNEPGGMAAPRVQDYAMTSPGTDSASVAVDNARGGWEKLMHSLQEDFRKHFQVSEAEAALAAVALLVPGGNLRHFAWLWNISEVVAGARLGALAPGILFADQEVQFGDKDFEENFRRVSGQPALKIAHQSIAECFYPRRNDDAFCAKQVAIHLHSASLFDMFIDFSLKEPEPPTALFPNPRDRSAISTRRVDLALAGASQLRRWEDVVELCLIRAEVSRVRSGLRNLFWADPCLAAQFHGVQAIREVVLDSSGRMSTPHSLWSYALVLASTGKLTDAEAYLKRGFEVLRVLDPKKQERVQADHVATYIHAAYATGGLGMALAAFRRWRRQGWHRFLKHLRWKLADYTTPEQREEILFSRQIPVRYRLQIAASLWRRAGFFRIESLCSLIDWLGKRPPGRVGQRRNFEAGDEAWSDILAVTEAAVAAGISLKKISDTVRIHMSPMPEYPSDNWTDFSYGRWGVAVSGRALLRHCDGGKIATSDIKEEFKQHRAEEGRSWDHFADSSLSDAVSISLDRLAMLRVRSLNEHKTILSSWVVAMENGKPFQDWERPNYVKLQGKIPIWILTLLRLDGVDAAWLGRLLKCGSSLHYGGAESLQWLLQLSEIAGEFCHLSDYSDEAHRFLRDCIYQAGIVACDQQAKRSLLLSVAVAARDHSVKKEAWEAAVRHAGQCGREDLEPFQELMAVAYAVGARGLSNMPALAAEIVSWAERFSMVTESADFPEKEVFSAVTSLHLPSALAMLSRWMDGAKAEADPGIRSIVETAVTQRVLSPFDGYGLLHLAMPGRGDGKLLCLLLSQAPERTEAERAAKQELLVNIAGFVQRDMPQRFRYKSACLLIEFAKKNGLEALTCIAQLRDLVEFLEKHNLGGSESQQKHFRPILDPEKLPDAPNGILELETWFLAQGNYLRSDAKTALCEWSAALSSHDQEDLLQTMLKSGQNGSRRDAVLDVMEKLIGRLAPQSQEKFSSRIIAFASSCLGDVGTMMYRRKLVQIINLCELAGMHEAEFLANIVTMRAASEEYWIPALSIATHAINYCEVEKLVVRLEKRLSWMAERWFPEEAVIPTPPMESYSIEASDALADFYWACFTHPDKRVRCRTLYAVLDTIRISRKTERLVGKLVGFVKATDTGNFRDLNQGPCFWISGRVFLWRLLRRIANDFPKMLAPHIELLCDAALDKELPHVLIRELARGTLLALSDSGIHLPSGLKEQVLLLNRPKAATEDYEHKKASAPHADHRYDFQGSRFGFDQTDTIPKWFGSLARAFDLLTTEIVNKADVWVCDRWGIKPFKSWHDEPRRAHMVGNDYSRWSNRHGEEPELENLSKYAAYHSMFCVAGELIDAGSLAARPSEWDPKCCLFMDWLSTWHGHEDSIQWGRDHLTAPPLSPLAWGILPTREQACCPLAEDDFDSALRLEFWDKDWFVVHGYEGSGNEDVRHSVFIETYLLPEEYAYSFCAACQTRKWPDQRWIPGKAQLFPWNTRDEDRKPFTWTPLVVLKERDRRWLDHDPFLMRANANVYRPSAFTANALRIDSDSRYHWKNPTHGVFAQIQKWSEQEKSGGRNFGQSTDGHLLWFRISTLLALLRSEQKAAVIMVSINRNEKNDSSFEEDKIFHPERDCAVYYVVRGDTTVATMAGTRRLGEPLAGKPWQNSAR